MLFRSIKSATTFIKKLCLTRGYSKDATSGWRRLSMKLSDCALIQYPRRLAVRLETEQRFLVGVDEQDFNPKIYVVHENKYCVLCLMKRVDEQTKQVRYALGHVGEEISGHSIDVSGPPTDRDLRHALILIESMSLNTGVPGPTEGSKRPKGEKRRQ